MTPGLVGTEPGVGLVAETASPRRPTLLHITADHPDRVNPRKTAAVSGLLAASTWGDHVVFSLNRVASPSRATPFVKEVGNQVFSARYLGLPFGLGLSHWMTEVAKRIEEQLRHDGIRPDLIHAHKLTFEGLAAHRLAQRLEVPFVVTVRGHTDHRVITAKPMLRNRFRRIALAARRVFFLAPWSRARLEAQLGVSIPDAEMLPNICTRMVQPEATMVPQERFVSLFHFRSHRVKNIDRVFIALRRLRQQGLEVTLDVIGAGDTEELRLMQDLARSKDVGPWVQCLPAMSHAQLQQVLPQYAALVLPSYPETFGMVYIEAISAGLPVIHARRSGIDGYFEDDLIATAVDHRDVEELAGAMRIMLEQRLKVRERVTAFVAGGGLDQFTAHAVAERYRRAVVAALGLDRMP